MVYVFLANGFEEMEALAPVDCLRRCGFEVVTVGIGGTAIRGSHGIVVAADITEDEMVLSSRLEMIVLPGGMPGTLNLETSQAVQRAIAFCQEQKIYIAAICAAPSILGHLDLLRGRQAVCYTGFAHALTGAEVLDTPVCVSDHIITARGAGVALQFALQLVTTLQSKERSDLLAAALLCE